MQRRMKRSRPRSVLSKVLVGYDDADCLLASSARSAASVEGRGLQSCSAQLAAFGMERCRALGFVVQAAIAMRSV